MLLANIVPTELVGELPTYSAAHLALSNLVARNGDYARFYRQMALEGELVILDVPEHESVPLDEEAWIYAIRELVRPTVIVLPDSIESSNRTIDNAVRLAGEVTKLRPKSALMGVPHGETLEEFIACAIALCNLGCSWLGVSLERRLNDDKLAVKNREERIRALKLNGETRHTKIHLLGISEEATELDNPFLMRTCESVDASKFAVWLLTGSPVVPPVPIRQEYPGRKALGGSIEYFDYRPTLGNWPRGLRANLSRWCAYANRQGVI